jgi:alkanesulfonate monooxygenase SsuD/methylene tetrahydromethanopterin reductase-like flavin-dependent oxidoreductase (luciferase family)
MKVGASIFCQNFYRTQRPDHEVYRDDLALAELVEPLGFDSLWAVEHHFSPYTMIPDVTQFLSYICGRTKRLGLGTMVVVLPWHDPVRVAEEIAMLSLFARGRELTLGFGRGSGRIEYEGLRIPMGESRERFVEAAEIVKLALSKERFSFKGQFYQVPEMSLRPRPQRTDLLDHFYGAIVSPESGDIMARAGMGMLIIPQKPWSAHAKDYQAYLGSCRKFGQSGRRPIAITWVYCAKDEKTAAAGRDQWMANYGESALVHYEYNDAAHFHATKGYEHHAKMAEAMSSSQGSGNDLTRLGETQCFGTPERCLEVLREIRKTVDAEEFVGVFSYGGMPLEEAERSMKLFADEVLPKVHAEDFG